MEIGFDLIRFEEMRDRRIWMLRLRLRIVYDDLERIRRPVHGRAEDPVISCQILVIALAILERKERVLTCRTAPPFPLFFSKLITLISICPFAKHF